MNMIITTVMKITNLKMFIIIIMLLLKNKNQINHGPNTIGIIKISIKNRLQFNNKMLQTMMLLPLELVFGVGKMENGWKLENHKENKNNIKLKVNHNKKLVGMTFGIQNIVELLKILFWMLLMLNQKALEILITETDGGEEIGVGDQDLLTGGMVLFNGMMVFNGWEIQLFTLLLLLKPLLKFLLKKLLMLH